MKLKKKEVSFLHQVIRQWVEEGSLTDEKAKELRQTLEVQKFDWQSLSLYAFFFAVASLVVAVVTVLADRWIIELMEQLLNSADLYKSLFFAILAIVLFYLANLRKRKFPLQKYSNEAVFFTGIISTAAAITYLGLHLNAGQGHFSLLILFSTIVYAVLALLFRSTLTWIFAIIALGAWFGTETGLLSEWDAYFLGMNYPLRFLFFGLGLILFSFAVKKLIPWTEFFQITLLFGLIHFFLSLYLLSIFGNYGDLDSWYAVKQTELLYWGILMAIISIISILIGLKTDYPFFREFGVIFLFLDLYTRYFEFFWDSLHKAVFFSILAVSFWLIGKKAEKIWSMDF